jgi:hypothetical protein
MVGSLARGNTNIGGARSCSASGGCWWILLNYHARMRDNRGVTTNWMVPGRWVGSEDLACLLFGEAAWRCAPRDQALGWNEAGRRRRLPHVANNTRLLILPWVRVPQLASATLGAVSRRIAVDWQATPEARAWVQPLLKSLRTGWRGGRVAGQTVAAALARLWGKLEPLGPDASAPPVRVGQGP